MPVPHPAAPSRFRRPAPMDSTCSASVRVLARPTATRTPSRVVVHRNTRPATPLPSRRRSGDVDQSRPGPVHSSRHAPARAAVIGRAALAENLVHARQAACSYSWRMPPRRSRLRMLRWAISRRSIPVRSMSFCRRRGITLSSTRIIRSRPITASSSTAFGRCAGYRPIGHIKVDARCGRCDYAARAYSLIRPPRIGRRSTRPASTWPERARGGFGGCWPSVRCGR
jgi:hypothetical protein